MWLERITERFFAAQAAMEKIEDLARRIAELEFVMAIEDGNPRLQEQWECEVVRLRREMDRLPTFREVWS